MEVRRRFRILKELAEGAFGKVYLAEMITGDNFKSVVAIKLLHGKWVGHEEIVQRSRDEARVLGLLHHRNIVRVEDLTSINGQCAVIMEYLEGVDVKNLIRHCRDQGKPFPRQVAFEIAASTASALDAAYHRKALNSGEPLRVIHRDIKPSNVMVTVAGEVKVLDFGTARGNFEHREAETKALAFGSAAYMAPERMLGDQDGPNGDVFSLGVTLFEMLALQGFGKVFIRGDKYDKVLEERIINLDFRDMDDERASQIRATLKLMLAYEPEERPTAAVVVQLMEALAEEIKDGSLRRFCREIVAPCHRSSESPVSPDDPITGSTLFEDTSLRGENEEEDNTGAGLRPATIDPPEHDIPALKAGLGFITSDSHTEAPLSEDTQEPMATVVPAVTFDPEQLEAIPAESTVDGPTVSEVFEPHSRSSNVWLVAVALMGLALGVAVLYGGFKVLTGAEKTATTALDLPEVPKYLPGVRMEANRAGGAGGDLVLNIENAKSAKVNITANLTDYHFKWDGTNTLEVVDLEPGTYRTRIVADGRVTSLVAEVEAGRACAYRYDTATGDEVWTDARCSRR